MSPTPKTCSFLTCIFEKTGTYNTTGRHYRGHFSIWITNQLQEHLITLQDMFNEPVQIGGWVNGNLYTPTSESFGILPIPDDIRLSSGMAPFVPSTCDSSQQHWFLASKQGTRKPILPVHTKEEHQLFKSLLKHDPSFTPQTGEPNWRAAVKVWNSYADRTGNVYYKVWSTYAFSESTLGV